MPMALGATKSSVFPGPAPGSFCFCFRVSVATTSLPPTAFLSSVTLPSEEASFSLLYTTRQIKVGWGKRSGRENGDREWTSRMQPGDGAAMMCPPLHPGLPTGSPTASIARCDCPSHRVCQALQERLRLGEEGVWAWQAGWAQICLPLSVFTHQRPGFGPRPPSLPPRSLLVGILPFPRPGCKVAPQEVPTPSELPTTPPHLVLHHLTIPPRRQPSALQVEPMSPHSMSQWGHRRPRGTWGHRVGLQPAFHRQPAAGSP